MTDAPRDVGAGAGAVSVDQIDEDVEGESVAVELLDVVAETGDNGVVADGDVVVDEDQ